MRETTKEEDGVKTREVDRIAVAEIANGHQLELLIHRLPGVDEGPRLGLIGGIHGDEPLGIEISSGSLGTPHSGEGIPRKNLFLIRETVLVELENARKSKLIGKALEVGRKSSRYG